MMETVIDQYIQDVGDGGDELQEKRSELILKINLVNKSLQLIFDSLLSNVLLYLFITHLSVLLLLLLLRLTLHTTSHQEQQQSSFMNHSQVQDLSSSPATIKTTSSSQLINLINPSLTKNRLQKPTMPPIRSILKQSTLSNKQKN